jgi:hypothetical protein
MNSSDKGATVVFVTMLIVLAVLLLGLMVSDTIVKLQCCGC